METNAHYLLSLVSTSLYTTYSDMSFVTKYDLTMPLEDQDESHRGDEYCGLFHETSFGD